MLVQLAQSLSQGRCRDPFRVLGPHHDAASGQVNLRVFLPQANAVRVLSRHADDSQVALTPQGGDGLFVGVVPAAVAADYRLGVY